MTSQITTPYFPQDPPPALIYATEITNDIGNTADTEKIVSEVLQYDFVLGARAFIWNNNIVVAILTSPFYLKSERDAAKETVENDLKNSFGDYNVIVTMDMHIYRNIRENLSDLSKEKLFELASER